MKPFIICGRFVRGCLASAAASCACLRRGARTCRARAAGKGALARHAQGPGSDRVRQRRRGTGQDRESDRRLLAGAGGTSKPSNLIPPAFTAWSIRPSRSARWCWRDSPEREPGKYCCLRTWTQSICAACLLSSRIASRAIALTAWEFPTTNRVPYLAHARHAEGDDFRTRCRDRADQPTKRSVPPGRAACHLLGSEHDAVLSCASLVESDKLSLTTAGIEQVLKCRQGTPPARR